MKRFILAAVFSLTIFIAGTHSQTIDHFSVQETYKIQGWNVISGDWMIANEMLISPSTTSPSYIMSSADAVNNGSAEVRITYGNTDQPQSAGLVARYLSPEKNITAMVTDEGGLGSWNKLSIYSNGILLKSLTAKLGSDLILKMIYQKSNIVVMVDFDRDGIWDFSFSCITDNVEEGLSGLMSSGECFIDDYQSLPVNDRVNGRISRDASRISQVSQKQSLNMKAIENAKGDALAIRVYPNPASGMLQIDFTGTESGSALLELFDVSGRLVNSQPVSIQSGNNSVNVDYSDQPEGMYYLVLQAGDLRSGQSLIISR
jgi:hypothetical protein